MNIKGHNWGFCRLCGKDHGLHPRLGVRLSDETKGKISVTNKGRLLPEETKMKMSDARRGEKHPLYGTHRSKETKEKISVAHRGKRHHNYGKHLSEETKRKIGDANKENRMNGVYSNVFTRPTTIEVMLRNFLENNGIPYSTEKIIDIGYKIRIPDVFIEPNIILEADGTYYHSENCYGVNMKAEDEKADKILKKLGYIIYRVSEKDFKNGKYLETLNGIVTKHKP